MLPSSWISEWHCHALALAYFRSRSRNVCNLQMSPSVTQDLCFGATSSYFFHGGCFGQHKAVRCIRDFQNRKYQNPRFEIVPWSPFWKTKIITNVTFLTDLLIKTATMLNGILRSMNTRKNTYRSSSWLACNSQDSKGKKKKKKHGIPSQ